MRRFIQYGRHLIDSTDVRAVRRVLRSEYLTTGPSVEIFEKGLARTCGAKYAVAVSSGTSALHLAYLVAGLKNGDEVITTPNTFVATSNMILTVGAKPIFCDIREDTYNIDEKKIERLITKRTRAIVPVHIAGHVCDMGSITRIAKRRKLIVIEDACHALGAAIGGRRVGSLGSDMTVFSFHPVKSITTGEGGVVLTNDMRLYKKLMLLRSHGVTKDADGFNVMTDLGYNYRLTDLQAALGTSQLRKLRTFIVKRRRVAGWYAEEFRRFDRIITPIELRGVSSSWHLYVIRTARASDRTPLMNYLKSHRVGANMHYPVVYKHPYYKALGYRGGTCPVAEHYAATALTLPLHPGLSRSDIRYIAQTVKNYFTA